MGEITTAHIMMIIGLFAIIVPIFTVLGILLLNRILGGGDALKSKVHKLELNQKDMEARIGKNVRDEYATKDDIKRLESMIAQLGESQRQYTEAVQTLLKPIADQLVVGTVHR